MSLLRAFEEAVLQYCITATTLTTVYKIYLVLIKYIYIKYKTMRTVTEKCFLILFTNIDLFRTCILLENDRITITLLHHPLTIVTKNCLNVIYLMFWAVLLGQTN